MGLQPEANTTPPRDSPTDRRLERVLLCKKQSVFTLKSPCPAVQNRGGPNHCTHTEMWTFQLPYATHTLSSPNSVVRILWKRNRRILGGNLISPKRNGDSPTNGPPRISWYKSKGPTHVKQEKEGRNGGREPGRERGREERMKEKRKNMLEWTRKKTINCPGQPSSQDCQTEENKREKIFSTVTPKNFS